MGLVPKEQVVEERGLDLAVPSKAIERQGRSFGLLDVDIHGPILAKLMDIGRITFSVYQAGDMPTPIEVFSS